MKKYLFSKISKISVKTIKACDIYVCCRSAPCPSLRSIQHDKNSTVVVCDQAKEAFSPLAPAKEHSFILISYGCCNKLPQPWWIKTPDIYSKFLVAPGAP